MASPMAHPTDAELRELAKERVGFKAHALAYALVNAGLAVVWLLTRSTPDAFYWPAYPHLGWGIGLAFHAFGAYGGASSWVRREEESLRRRYGGAR